MSLLRQMSTLLPLPDEDLQQILDYASSLSKDEVATHFTNLLGDTPNVADFVVSFNSCHDRIPNPAQVNASSSSGTRAMNDTPSAVSKVKRGSKKKKAPLHTPPPRQISLVQTSGGTVYKKSIEENDYIAGRTETVISPARTSTPPSQVSTKPSPFTAGTLISDLPSTRSKSKTKAPPNTSSSSGSGSKAGNKAVAKVSLVGGTPMQSVSVELADLDAAIQSLELTTNPTHPSNNSADVAARRCNCVAVRHPLQTAAPNCLNCGKVICVKEGLGPCTFCGEPLISSGEVQAMIKELRMERGRERMVADRAAHRKADVARTPKPFTTPRTGPSLSAAESKALEHRDKLLSYQAENAQRTTIRDEASDFDVSAATSVWSSPEERARQLRKQQRLLREMEWRDMPEYVKRRQVVSIDLVGGKVVKKMVAIDRPKDPDEDDSR